MKITKYKKQGKNYYKFQIRLGDKVTRRSGFKSKNEAIFAYTQLIEDYQDKVNGNITYYQVYKEWIKIYETTVKETTFANTILIFKNHILPIFGDKKIENITVKECQDFAISKKDYVKGNAIVLYAKKVLTYATKIYNLKSNPFDKIILPKFKEPKKIIKYLEPYQVQKLLDYFKDNLYWYALFRTLIYTGMRRGEALALKWQDIDLKKSKITISRNLGIGKDQKQIITTPKNNTSLREIDIDKKTTLTLKELKIQAKSQVVFPNRVGTYRRLSDIDDQLQKALKDTNLPKIRVHDLRHTHASLLFASGADMKYVQQRLGHNDIKTTMNIYTHVTKNQKEKNLDNFVDYMEQSS